MTPAGIVDAIAAIDLGSPFRITAGGFFHYPARVDYVPTLEHDDDADVLIDGIAWKDAEPWELMTGWTGQYSYSGPVMHASETISEGMAAWMQERPGIYVCVVVDAPCHYDGSTECSEDTGCDCEPAGWAVLYRHDDA